MKPTCSAVQAALLQFAQSCFVGGDALPEPTQQNRTWLYDFLDAAASLSAAEVATWPATTQAALKHAISEMIVMLELRLRASGEFLLPPGTLDATTSQRLGKGMLIGIASRRWSSPG